MPLCKGVFDNHVGIDLSNLALLCSTPMASEVVAMSSGDSEENTPAGLSVIWESLNLWAPDATLSLNFLVEFLVISERLEPTHCRIVPEPQLLVLSEGFRRCRSSSEVSSLILSCGYAGTYNLSNKSKVQFFYKNN